MPTLFQDLRYSARQLIKNPGFTLTALISLALGIGAATAVFSVIYAVLMNPYPYPAADRIVRLTTQSVAGSGDPVYLNGAANSDFAAITSGRKCSGDGLPGADVDGPGSSGERKRREPYLEQLSGSWRAPYTRARTLGVRRGGWPGATTGCSSFLPILAQTLLVQPGRSGPDAATRSQEL